jgi:Na+-driven multidrug efflux pump
MSLCIEGLAGAVEVRVAYHMGHSRPERAKRCAWKTVLLGFEIAVFSTAILYIIAEYIPSWLSPDPTQQRMIYETLPLVGVGQICMFVLDESYDSILHFHSLIFELLSSI